VIEIEHFKKKLALFCFLGVISVVIYMSYKAYQSSGNWFFAITVFGVSLAYSIKILGTRGF
jgi:hypothetical protein